MSTEKSQRRRGAEITQADYHALSQFRYLIRCFLEFSQNAAKAVGLQPRHHQALLAIKGYPTGGPVTVGDLAERLRIRHHSAVELVDRAAAEQLVERRPDLDDHRAVRLALTREGAARLRRLSRLHLDELRRLSTALGGLSD